MTRPAEHVGPCLLTPKQAGNILGLTTRALEERRRRGSGPPYVRLGGSAVRYDLADLQEWVDARKYESTAEESAAAGSDR